MAIVLKKILEKGLNFSRKRLLNLLNLMPLN